jgi:hypothetical protein
VQNLNNLVGGLKLVETDIEKARQLEAVPGDRFIEVMEVGVG